MLTGYATVLAFLLVAWAVALGAILTGKLFRPSLPSEAPGPPPHRESGEDRSGVFRFDPRFFRVALLALLFDAAIALLYPVAVVFKRLVADGHGARAFGEIFGFVGVVFFALAYASKKGDLEWGRAPSRSGAENDR
jgi:NADH-quinone oxidoreductase subunit A